MVANWEKKKNEFPLCFPLLELLIITLRRLKSLRGASFNSDPVIIKECLNIWVFVILLEEEFEKLQKENIKKLCFFMPHLVEISAKGFTNQIMLHELSNSQQFIRLYRRKFKHFLREKFPEQRP